MSERRLQDTHQSDPDCLARLRFQRTHGSPASEASLVGTLCHRAVERMTVASATEGADVGMMEVRDVLAEVLDDPAVTGRVVEQVVTIMAAALGPRSKLRFFLEPGWSCAPEWSWWLDEDFQPLAEADRDRAAYAGTCDRLEVHTEHGVRITDYKTILAHPAAWEIRGAWQARVYALAALAHFPRVRRIAFRFVLLRHGYWIEETFARGEPWEETTRARLRAIRAKRLRAIERDEWPETLGQDCAWCPRILACSAMRQVLEDGDPRSIPGIAPDEIARRAVATKALAALYDRCARHLVEKHGDPLPLGDGSVLGGKPTQGWELARPLAAILDDLRGHGMTREQEAEWFGCPEHLRAGKVKKALHELCGPAAKGLIETGEYVEPVTREQFAVWEPETTTPERIATLEDVDAAIDRALSGG